MMQSNKTSEPEKKTRKAQSQVDKKRYQEKRKSAVQVSLRQQWQEWASNYSSAEEALAEGIWWCDHASEKTNAALDDYDEPMKIWLAEEPSFQADSSRLVQFEVLKDLWLRRNQANLLSAEKVRIDKFTEYLFTDFDDFGEAMFEKRSKRQQLYLYELEVCGRHYRFHSYQKLSLLPDDIANEKAKLSSSLALEKRQPVDVPLHKLLPVIEWGARNFWAERWSKKENRLLPLSTKSSS